MLKTTSRLMAALRPAQQFITAILVLLLPFWVIAQPSHLLTPEQEAYRTKVFIAPIIFEGESTGDYKEYNVEGYLCISKLYVVKHIFKGTGFSVGDTLEFQKQTKLKMYPNGNVETPRTHSKPVKMGDITRAIFYAKSLNTKPLRGNKYNAVELVDINWWSVAALYWNQNDEPTAMISNEITYDPRVNLLQDMYHRISNVKMPVDFVPSLPKQLGSGSPLNVNRLPNIPLVVSAANSVINNGWYEFDLVANTDGTTNFLNECNLRLQYDTTYFRPQIWQYQAAGANQTTTNSTILFTI